MPSGDYPAAPQHRAAGQRPAPGLRRRAPPARRRQARTPYPQRSARYSSQSARITHLKTIIPQNYCQLQVARLQFKAVLVDNRQFFQVLLRAGDPFDGSQGLVRYPDFGEIIELINRPADEFLGPQGLSWSGRSAENSPRTICPALALSNIRANLMVTSPTM